MVLLLHLPYRNDRQNLFNELSLHVSRKGANSGHKNTQRHKKTQSHLRRTWLLASLTLKDLYSILEVYLLSTVLTNHTESNLLLILIHSLSPGKTSITGKESRLQHRYVCRALGRCINSILKVHCLHW